MGGRKALALPSLAWPRLAVLPGLHSYALALPCRSAGLNNRYHDGQTQSISFVMIITPFSLLYTKDVIRLKFFLDCEAVVPSPNHQ